MKHAVILESDHDSDGVSYGAHRITVPDTMDLTDHETVMAYAKATDQISSYYDAADEVLNLIIFRGLYFPAMNPRERAYFNKVGYTNDHMTPNWYPWAGPNGDDTIGIPALDTRYDD